MPKIIKNGLEYSGVPTEAVTAWPPTSDPVQATLPEMGNTDISAIGDGTVTGAISELKSGLMWQTLASGVSSSVRTSIANIDYKELLLVARYSNAAYSVLALKTEIDAGHTIWSSGVFFRTGTWVGVQFGYDASAKTISLSYINNSGTDVIASSTYSVYYR